MCVLNLGTSFVYDLSEKNSRFAIEIASQSEPDIRYNSYLHCACMEYPPTRHIVDYV